MTSQENSAKLVIFIMKRGAAIGVKQEEVMSIIEAFFQLYLCDSSVRQFKIAKFVVNFYEVFYTPGEPINFVLPWNVSLDTDEDGEMRYRDDL